MYSLIRELRFKDSGPGSARSRMHYVIYVNVTRDFSPPPRAWEVLFSFSSNVSCCSDHPTKASVFCELDSRTIFKPLINITTYQYVWGLATDGGDLPPNLKEQGGHRTR